MSMGGVSIKFQPEVRGARDAQRYKFFSPIEPGKPLAMPTPLKHSRNMTKHLTKSERESRQTAESALEHKRQVRIMAPAWLSGEARKVFQTTRRRLRDFDLLEPVDIDLLAMYADAVVRYQEGVKTLGPLSEAREIQAVQAWSRIAMAYAEKLGFSQTARARLARRRATEEPLDPMEQLLGQVTDYVNGDGT